MAMGLWSSNMAVRWLKRVWASSWCMSCSRSESEITSKMMYLATELDQFHASSLRESNGFGAAPVRWLTTLLWLRYRGYEHGKFSSLDFHTRVQGARGPFSLDTFEVRINPVFHKLAFSTRQEQGS